MTTDELIRFLRNYANYELSNGRVVSNYRLLDCADRLEELDERVAIMSENTVTSVKNDDVEQKNDEEGNHGMD